MWYTAPTKFPIAFTEAYVGVGTIQESATERSSSNFDNAVRLSLDKIEFANCNTSNGENHYEEMTVHGICKLPTSQLHSLKYMLLQQACQIVPKDHPQTTPITL